MLKALLHKSPEGIHVVTPELRTLHDSESQAPRHDEIRAYDLGVWTCAEASSDFVEAGPEPRLRAVSVLLSRRVFLPRKPCRNMAQQGYGNRGDGDEQRQLTREREARVLEVQSARLAVREQALDEPSLPIEPKDARSAARMRGGDHQKLASLDPARAEMEVQVRMTRAPGQHGLEAPHALAARQPRPQRQGAALDMDDLLLLHANGERDFLFHEKGEPFLANKLTISEQHTHGAGVEARQIARHQGDALRRGAVARMVEHRPHQRHPKPRRDHCQDEHVDVGLADLPVGPVKAEIPRPRAADQGGHEADGPVLWQADMLEKTLQAAVGRRNQRARGPLRRDVRQIDCAGADHAKQQDAERLEPRLAERHMRG